MRKTTTITILMLFMIPSLYSQQIRIPDDWDINLPSDTMTHIFSRGVSDPKDTERAATIEAENMAIISLAQKIYMLVDSRYIGVTRKDGSEIHEFALEVNDIVTRIYLSGVTRKIKIKKEGGKYIAYCLAYIHRSEAEKALIQAENELTALNVYRYFMNKIPGKLKPFNVTENPEGYHSWLINNIQIISIHGDNQAFFLNQLETFIRIILPDVVTYAAKYNREPVKFIYAPDGLERIAGALRRHGIHFLREYPRLIVYASPRLGDLIKMNPSMVYVAGFEAHRDSQNIFARELIHQIQNANKKSAVFLSLPPELNIGGGKILEYIMNRNPSCRYLIVYTLQTVIEPELRAFNIPPHLFATSQVLVYDLIFGDIIFAENLKNGIPINNEYDLTNTSHLLIRRLLTPSVVESISNAMEAGNEL
jgi:hypothetical protein